MPQPKNFCAFAIAVPLWPKPSAKRETPNQTKTQHTNRLFKFKFLMSTY